MDMPDLDFSGACEPSAVESAPSESDLMSELDAILDSVDTSLLPNPAIDGFLESLLRPPSSPPRLNEVNLAFGNATTCSIDANVRDSGAKVSMASGSNVVVGVKEVLAEPYSRKNTKPFLLTGSGIAQASRRAHTGPKKDEKCMERLDAVRDRLKDKLTKPIKDRLKLEAEMRKEREKKEAERGRMRSKATEPQQKKREEAMNKRSADAASSTMVQPPPKKKRSDKPEGTTPVKNLRSSENLDSEPVTDNTPKKRTSKETLEDGESDVVETPKTAKKKKVVCEVEDIEGGFSITVPQRSLARSLTPSKPRNIRGTPKDIECARQAGLRIYRQNGAENNPNPYCFMCEDIVTTRWPLHSERAHKDVDPQRVQATKALYMTGARGPFCENDVLKPLLDYMPEDVAREYVSGLKRNIGFATTTDPDKSMRWLPKNFCDKDFEGLPFDAVNDRQVEVMSIANTVSKEAEDGEHDMVF